MPNVVVYVNDELYLKYKELDDVEDKELKIKITEVIEKFIKVKSQS